MDNVRASNAVAILSKLLGDPTDFLGSMSSVSKSFDSLLLLMSWTVYVLYDQQQRRDFIANAQESVCQSIAVLEKY